MVPMQRLDVLDLERVEIEILETENGDGVLCGRTYYNLFSRVS